MKKTNPDDSLAESFDTAYTYAWNCLFIYANQWIPFLFKPASIGFFTTWPEDQYSLQILFLPVSLYLLIPNAQK